MMRRLPWAFTLVVLPLLAGGCGSSSSNTWQCVVSCNGGPQQSFTITASSADAACTQAVMNADCGPSFTCNCTQ